MQIGEKNFLSGKEETRRNPDGFQEFLTQPGEKFSVKIRAGAYWYSFLMQLAQTLVSSPTLLEISDIRDSPMAMTVMLLPTFQFGSNKNVRFIYHEGHEADPPHVPFFENTS